MLKKGDCVVMHSCMEAEFEEGKIWVCQDDEFTSIGKEQVIFLEGYSGYFLCKYLQKVNFDFSYQQFLSNEKNYVELINEHAEYKHFKDTAVQILSNEQLEEIEDEMDNIPELSI